MRGTMVAVAALLLAGCGGKGGTDNASAAANEGGPVKHQPGSWTNKIEVTKIDAGPGVDTAKIKAGLQQIFDAASTKSVCITPEMAAKGNPAANMERMAAQGKKCDFTRKAMNGEKLDFAGTCSDPNGAKLRVAVTGTNGATGQDLKVVSAPVDASGASQGSMEMRITSRRTGECKPGDLTPQAPVGQPG